MAIHSHSREAVSLKRRKNDTRREIYRLAKTKVLPRVTRQYLDAIGFSRIYNREEFTSLLDGYREQAFLASNPETFAHLYHLSETVSKWDGPGLVAANDEFREASAMTAFWDAEEQCRVANERLAGWEWRHSVPTKTIRTAQRLIAGVLGKLDLNELPQSCGFGPGASTSLKRANSSQQNKWQSSCHITANALPYHLAFIRWANLSALPREVTIVGGNHIATVPKNWKTWRTIAIEPDWNSFYQKGVGKMLRRRLQRIGLLLRDAQEFQGMFAREGSVTGELATLDLKAASDTLSVELIRALLPPDWFNLLSGLRSEYADLGPAGEYRYQKFSSMGNGYTFELETLVFWALTAAMVTADQRYRVSVYGDDIICPSAAVPALLKVFEGVGLTINTKKSFWGSHPFRESCGQHFYGGHDVTPFYIRKQLKTIGDLITLGNNCRTWASRHRSSEVMAVYESAFRVIPPLLRGPLKTSSSLQCAWDKATPYYNMDTQSFVHLTITRKPLWRDIWTWSGSYLFKLWVGVGDEYDAVEASYLTSASSREVVGETYVDACSWDIA